MSECQKVEVFAPASIGNVSVGFDLLGAAIAPIDGSLLGDKVSVCHSETPFSLDCLGRFVDKLPSDPLDNIVYHCWQAFSRLCASKHINVKPLQMTLEKNMPIGSGLGSSACSIVAALCALNEFHQQPLSDHELLGLMGEMEGRISGTVHYDNVAPAFLGGLQLMIETPACISQAVPFFANWYWVMAYPGIEVSTAQARLAMPTTYRLDEVVDHSRHLAAFIHACHSKQADLASAMLIDIIAEPYRKGALADFDAVRETAQSMGALATGISGSGPTVFCVCHDKETAQRLSLWLKTHYVQNEQGFVHLCRLDEQGVKVTRSQAQSN